MTLTSCGKSSAMSEIAILTAWKFDLSQRVKSSGPYDPAI